MRGQWYIWMICCYWENKGGNSEGTEFIDYLIEEPWVYHKQGEVRRTEDFWD